MKTNTITSRTPRSASTPAQEQFGIAPYRPQHGTRLSFAGAAAMTHTPRPVVLTDAGKGSDPRERKR
jgi:hypothetical protein